MSLISPLYDTPSGIRGFSFSSLRKFLWSQTITRVQILVPLKQPYLTSLGLPFPILKWEVQSTFLIGLFLGVSELTLTDHLYVVLNIVPITFGFGFVLLGHNSSSCLFQSLSSSFKLYKHLVVFSKDGPIFYYRLGKYFKIIVLYINTLNIFFQWTYLALENILEIDFFSKSFLSLWELMKVRMHRCLSGFETKPPKKYIHFKLWVTFLLLLGTN